MIPMTARHIAYITGGTLHDIDPDTQVIGPAEFDSRRITEGSIFLALPGARVDGHDFAAGAVESGAALALAARPVGAAACVVEPLGPQETNSDAFAHDPDGSGAAVLKALGALARETVDKLRAGCNFDVIGVTGSAGKTSVKDMIATVLRTEGETVAPKGSFNNEIGHPYTVLQCTDDTRYLVAEMSARGVGHIAHLAQIAPPTIGAVLNVGTAHLGEFGSRETIAQAKGELIESLPADGGVAVLNADDPLVAQMAPRTQARVVFFSVEGPADYRATDINFDGRARASFTLHTPTGSSPVQLQVFGAHQVPNALAAAAVGIESGLPVEQVANALSSHVAASVHRMDVRDRADGVTVIDDSYNANPDSVRAAVDALVRTAQTREGGRSIAVLGQMAELGDETEKEHRALAEVLVDRGVDMLLTVGDSDGARALHLAALDTGINNEVVSNCDGAVSRLAEVAGPGDVVLVKASYSDGLWRVADGLLNEISQDEGAGK